MMKKDLCLRDVYDPEYKASVVVPADEPFENVLHRFAEESSLRGIFVTDEAGQLIGTITRSDLLNWVRLRLGTAWRVERRRPDHALQLARLVRTATARDAISPGSEKAAVRLDDPVDFAVRNMLELDLVAIPVIDDEGRVIGDITLSHVLRNLLDAVGER